MTKIPFSELPDDARLWIFGSGRPLDEAEERRLLDAVDRFLDGWKAHGTPLSAARDWRHGRFLLVAVDESTAPPSGCSIDSLVHLLKELEEDLGVVLVDNSPVWFQQGEEVRRASRAEFLARVGAGEVGPDTVVFDNTVIRVGALRDGEWEGPARESWHGKAFFPEVVD